MINGYPYLICYFKFGLRPISDSTLYLSKATQAVTNADPLSPSPSEKLQNGCHLTTHSYPWLVILRRNWPTDRMINYELGNYEFDSTNFQGALLCRGSARTSPCSHHIRLARLVQITLLNYLQY